MRESIRSLSAVDSTRSLLSSVNVNNVKQSAVVAKSVVALSALVYAVANRSLQI
jgi:hypothetical protein